jgi:hypothetical protein
VCDCVWCRFAINSASGLVTVTASRVLNYEVRQSFQLSVTASDGVLQAVTSLTVHLNDTNDNPPVFPRPEYLAFVKEGEAHFRSPIQIQVCVCVLVMTQFFLVETCDVRRYNTLCMCVFSHNATGFVQFGHEVCNIQHSLQGVSSNE